MGGGGAVPLRLAGLRVRTQSWSQGFSCQGWRFGDEVPGIQSLIGVRMRGTLGDIDPLKQVLLRRAINRVKNCPL